MISRLSVSMLLLLLLPVRAQTPVDDARLPTLSDARLRSLLKELPFDFTESSTGDWTAFTIHFDGRVVTLLNQIKSLSLSACFDAGVDPMKSNQWNREHFSTRAFLSETGCTSLGSDVSFGGGFTNRMIQDFVHQFCTDLVIFARYLASDPLAPGIQSRDQLASPIGAMAWSQRAPFTKSLPSPLRMAGSVPGLLKISPTVSLKYDPRQWKLAAPPSDGHFAFSDSSGAANALVVLEPTAVPLGAIEDLALANAQSVDPHARVVFRNRRWVKGVTLCFLKIEAIVGSIPMVYWGNFSVGEGGTVQVITYTEKSRLPEFETRFMDFLDGLTVVK